MHKFAATAILTVFTTTFVIASIAPTNLVNASSCSFSSSSGSGSSSGSTQSSGGCSSITSADQRVAGGGTATSSRHQTCTPFGESCTTAPKPSMCTGEINGGPNENIGPGSCSMGGVALGGHPVFGGSIDGANGGQSSCVAASGTQGPQGLEAHSKGGSVSCSAHSP
jgi:hypothetical protein